MAKYKIKIAKEKNKKIVKYKEYFVAFIINNYNNS